MGKTQLLRRLLVDSGAVVALICRHRYASHSYGLEREKEGGGAAGGDCPVTLTGIPLRFLSPFPLTGPPPLFKFSLPDTPCRPLISSSSLLPTALCRGSLAESESIHPPGPPGWDQATCVANVPKCRP